MEGHGELSTMPEWATEFRAFSLYHAVVASALFAWIGLATVLGRRWRGGQREMVLARGWGVVVLITMTAASAHWIVMHFRDPEQYTWRFVLPLQICDLMPFVAGLAIITRVRSLESVTVFWGLGLCSQAFLTPTVVAGYSEFHFWYFWISHTYIIGTAVYLVGVRRYRPDWHDFRVGLFTALGYTIAMVPVDYFMDWNYAFVGQEIPTPGRPETVLKYLGPWPWRLPVLGVCVLIAMLLVKAGLWLLPTPPGTKQPAISSTSATNAGTLDA